MGQIVQRYFIISYIDLNSIDIAFFELPLAPVNPVTLQPTTLLLPGSFGALYFWLQTISLLLFSLILLSSYLNILLCTVVLLQLGRFSIFSRIHMNAVPCRGLVKKSASVLPIRKYAISHRCSLPCMLQRNSVPQGVLYACCLRW